jgi:hypothetical protein
MPLHAKSNRPCCSIRDFILDMFPRIRQVQGSRGRLAGVHLPKYPDTEPSFEELKARIAKTVDFLQTLKPTQIDGSEGRGIRLPIAGEARTFSGQTYLIHFALPNFYSHVTTAYAVLRHCASRSANAILSVPSSPQQRPSMVRVINAVVFGLIRSSH